MSAGARRPPPPDWPGDAAQPADTHDLPRERRGGGSTQRCILRRRAFALLCLGAMAAGSAAAIAWSAGAGTASAGALHAKMAGSYVSVQPGPAVTASTLAIIQPASVSPASPSPPAPSVTPTASPWPSPSGTPIASPSPAPTPTSTTATPSPSSRPRRSPAPTGTPTASPSATELRAPPGPGRPIPTPISGPPERPTAPVRVPVPLQAAVSHALASPSSQAPTTVPSPSAPAAGASRLAHPPRRALARTPHDIADTGPSAETIAATIAVALAALAALSGSFVLIRRHLAYTRRMPKHSRSPTRQRSSWSLWS